MENTTYSFLDFQNIQNDEQKLIDLLESDMEAKTLKSPKSSSVNAILAYSQALSIRKSHHLGFIEKILN